MAALLLAGAASAIGGAIGLTGITATLLSTAATIGGVFIDQWLFGPGKQKVEGPRLTSLEVMASTEGAPVCRGYGVFRPPNPQVIWATDFEEVVETDTEGGKGGPEIETTTYSYFANFAVALCEGPVGYLNRVWADGKELDLRNYTYRFYMGTETQEPDALIETKEGEGNVPGYRGIAYVVFERMPLDRFGNRIPQLTFEVLRPIGSAIAEQLVVGVNMIPGSTEFGYDSTIVEKTNVSEEAGGDVETGRAVENAHQFLDKSDWSVSLDQLAISLPNIDTVCLVVTWFGTDLRCGSCEIRPKVETADKTTSPISWQVAGVSRSGALLVSQLDDVPAFGGTPNDDSVIRAIEDLKDRGYRVMFYPFVMMDIPAGNSLPNPYSDNAATNGQPVYPWRGRITCSPAPGFAGSPDKTATAGTQVSAFVGTTNPGSSEWSFRRMILHYANLCADAGGVDYFCIGTEMVGLTQVRSGASTYPFVTALKTLAADVSAILPSAQIGYAADWSEYHSHRPGDGSNDVFFNLDPLWSDSNIDFVGIDNYLPMSDWRDGAGHLDWEAGFKSIYDLAYLKANIEGGEYYDWYYASQADRDAQVRTPIVDTDPAAEDWVFGNKRIKEWWQNAHHNRPGGVRSGSATGWTAESKPIFYTEFGCPAIDKGTNQPNVFFDPKSSESFVPYYSSGYRDDFIQRQAIRALYEYWNDNANNPLSSEYSGRMIDKQNIYVWSWDARPYPTFPHQPDYWADAANWQYGHWISARFGRVPIPDLMDSLADDYGYDGGSDFSRAYGVCDGFLIDRVMSLRQAWEPLEGAFAFDLIESGGQIKAVSKFEMPKVATIDLGKALDPGVDKETAQITRAQETDLPVSAKMTYIDIGRDFGTAAAESRRTAVRSKGVSQTDVPIIIDLPRAQQIVDRMLFSAWAERERAALALMPSLYALEPGDVIDLQINNYYQEVRIGSIRDGIGRQIEARSLDRAAFEGAATGGRSAPSQVQVRDMRPIVVLADLPLLLDENVSHRGYALAWASPWPGGINIYRSSTDSNYQLNTVLASPGIIGKTRFDFYSGPVARWDRVGELYVEIYGGSQLSSADDLAVFAGANACAVQNADGQWEILQFANAELTGTRQYKLTRLIRAQKGTDYAMRDPVAAGARFIMLTGAIAQIAMDGSQIGQSYHWKLGPANKPISSPLYSHVQFAYQGIAAKPLSPVHLRGRRDPANGDIVLSWIRRTRVGGDGGWDSADVPLGEPVERYVLEIRDGVDLIRSINSLPPYSEITMAGEATPSFRYTAAQQTADWGGPAPAFNAVVYQIGEFGRGFAALKAIDV